MGNRRRRFDSSYRPAQGEYLKAIGAFVGHQNEGAERVSAAAESLTAGDLPVNTEVNSKDEGGQLLARTQGMAGKLREIIGEVRSAAEQT